MSEQKWYHGGGRGYKQVLPSSKTGVPCSADYGASAVCSRDKVYVTKDWQEAAIFAALHPSNKGVIYEVVPRGAIGPDPDYTGPAGTCIECDFADIVARHKLPFKSIKKIRKALAT